MIEGLGEFVVDGCADGTRGETEVGGLVDIDLGGKIRADGSKIKRTPRCGGLGPSGPWMLSVRHSAATSGSFAIPLERQLLRCLFGSATI
jgi:hypothetical protein